MHSPSSMTDKRNALPRQLIYAALMVLFILLVEWMRRSDSNTNGVKEAHEDLDERPYRPNTGELDFEH